MKHVKSKGIAVSAWQYLQKKSNIEGKTVLITSPSHHPQPTGTRVGVVRLYNSAVNQCLVVENDDPSRTKYIHINHLLVDLSRKERRLFAPNLTTSYKLNVKGAYKQTQPIKSKVQKYIAE